MKELEFYFLPNAARGRASLLGAAKKRERERERERDRSNTTTQKNPVKLGKTRPNSAKRGKTG